MKLKVSGILAFAVIAMPFTAFAELPPNKNLAYVGKHNEGNSGEATSYVDITSLRKKGKLIHYKIWSVRKNEHYSEISGSSVYTKSEHAADCSNWQSGRFNVVAINRKGQIVRKFSDPLKLETPSSDTVEDKTLEVICK